MEEQHGRRRGDQPRNCLLLSQRQKVERTRHAFLFRAYRPALRLLITIIIAIFTAEVIAMVVVRAIQPIPYYQITLIDAGLMTILIFPVLYFFSFRPLLRQMEKSWQGEEKLRKALDELELRVQERTEELRLANIELQAEIAERKRAEIALREAADQFRIVADFTYDWELWRSPQNRFLYVSPSCERITGYSREAFYDKPDLILQIVHPDDRERVDVHYRDELLTGQSCEIEFRILRPDGQERWIGHACQLVRGEDGKMLGCRASNRDITERKRTEETLQVAHDELEQRVHERTKELADANRDILNEINERKLIEQQLRIETTALESAANGIIITGRRGNIRWANPAFLKMTGYTFEEVLGQTHAC